MSRSGEGVLIMAGGTGGHIFPGLAVADSLRRAGVPPVLVWLDAHGDFNTPETTPSGFLGGMPLAMLVGRVGPLAVLAGLQVATARRRQTRDGPESTARPVVSLFEFWPPWLFYAPLAPYWAWLSVRFGGPLTATASNPSIHAGGLIGESKSQILDLVSGDARRWIADYVAVEVGP